MSDRQPTTTRGTSDHDATSPAAKIHRRATAPAALPRRSAELTAAERLVVGALRHWIVGLGDNSGRHWSHAWNDLARELGSGPARDAVAGLTRLVATLGGHARGRIRHHLPCCPCLTADEVRLLGFIAACQAAAPAAARAQAEWLVRADGVGDLLAAGLALGQALGQRGQRLPVRAVRRPGAVGRCL